MMKKHLSIIAGISGGLFLLLISVIVWAPQSVGGIDTFAHMLVRPLQTPWWSSVFLVISYFGGTTGIVASALVLVWLYRHRPDIVARLVLALLAATVIGSTIKDLTHRVRPETLAGLDHISSFSFPSGHANESTVLYGFLALLLYVHASTRTRKIFALVIPGVCILLIGFSRIVLNYHFASDVLGGYLLGIFLVSFSLIIPLYGVLYHQNAIHSEPIERPLL